MAFCFRIRCNLSPRQRIESEEREITLADPGGKEIHLKAGERDEAGETQKLREASKIVILGKPFDSEEEAREAAEFWLGVTQRGFAHANLGADFGYRAPKSAFFAAGLRMVEEQVGQRCLNDTHGISTFECEPEPLFASAEASPVVLPPAERVTAAIEDAAQAAAVMTERERHAYDLYAASFFSASADARFALLMIAAESLIDPQPRSEEVRKHIDRLIAETKGSTLPPGEIESIVGSLQWLYDESIGQAGRKLAARLGNRTYMEGAESAEQFFTRSYTLRSRLFHGLEPPPTWKEVSDRTGAMEQFVKDLLSTPLR